MNLTFRGYPQLPNITCAVCNKPVDGVRVMRDDDKRTYIITVQCHGETDKCELNDLVFQRAGPQDLSQGVAFTTKRIDSK